MGWLQYWRSMGWLERDSNLLLCFCCCSFSKDKADVACFRVCWSVSGIDYFRYERKFEGRKPPVFSIMKLYSISKLLQYFLSMPPLQTHCSTFLPTCSTAILNPMLLIYISLHSFCMSLLTNLLTSFPTIPLPSAPPYC